MPSYRAGGSPAVANAAAPAWNGRQRSSQREDTPIVSRSSTPRSYRSTEQATYETTDSDERDEREDQRSQEPGQRAGQQSQQSDDSDGHGTPWYKGVIEKFGSLELENKGSVARDHLALERTFLSWLRTSLAFASIGIAITQLFRLNASLGPPDLVVQSNRPPGPILPPSDPYPPLLSAAGRSDRLRALGKPLGSTFIGIAIVVLLVGFHRYFESQYWVVRGKFPASRGSVALVAFITGALMVASLAVILATANGAIEG